MVEKAVGGDDDSPSHRKPRRGSGIGTVKALMIIFNLLSFIVGIIFIAGSIAAYVKRPFALAEGTEQASADRIYKLILGGGVALGAIITFLGFLGCCGAYNESVCALVVFATLMTIIAICQLAIGIALLAMKGTVLKEFEESLEKMEEKAEAGNRKSCVAYQQLSSYCCYGSGTRVEACDEVGNITCKETEGCTRFLVDRVDHSAKVAGPVSLGMVVIEILAIVFALMLVWNVREERKRRKKGLL